MDCVHDGCLRDIHVAIGPMGGESLYWVRVDVIVHVGEGFTKGPGLVFGLRRALTFALWRASAFALWRALTFALRRASAFALQRSLTFALWRASAFALRRGLAIPLRRASAFGLRRGLAFALRRASAFALRRALAFALRRALAFALRRAFAFGVGHVVQVKARQPGTKGKLLRLRGQQWVGWEVNNNPGWGVVAGDQGSTRAARHPAVGGLGDERRP